MQRPPFKARPMTSHHPVGPQFNDYEQPARDEFWRARSQIVTGWRYLKIPLDVAASNQVFQITGDFIYADLSSTGTLATLEFNNQTNDEMGGMQVSGGWYNVGPFVTVKASWAAQPGRFVKLLYATGYETYPGFGVIQVTQQGNVYASANSSSALLAAGASLQIFAAASNPNGADVWSAELITSSAAVNTVALMSKAGAPASLTDGDGYLTATCVAGGVSPNRSLPMPIRVPAGKGLYIFSPSLEVAHVSYVNYTLR